MVCRKLALLLESALYVGTGVHSDPSVEGVCGDGGVVGRISVGGGGQNIKGGPVLLSGCPLVAMGARALLRGSEVSTGEVSDGYSRGAAGGSEVAQLLSLGPRLSPGSCQWRSLFEMHGV